MRGAVEVSEREIPVGGQPRFDAAIAVARAEQALIAFLQVGTPVTLAAASALLRYQWLGHEQLSSFLNAVNMTLDEETRGNWSRQLGITLSQE